MDFMQDLFASVLGDRNTAVLWLLVAAVVSLFALIGILTVISENFNSGQRVNTQSHRMSRFRKLKALLLGGLAIAGPRLYKAVSSRPDFVDGLDRILDSCQSKLREIVISTASVRDDAILDAIDAVLDGFQEQLRKEVISKAKAWENPKSQGKSKRNTNR